MNRSFLRIGDRLTLKKNRDHSGNLYEKSRWHSHSYGTSLTVFPIGITSWLKDPTDKTTLFFWLFTRQYWQVIFYLVNAIILFTIRALTCGETGITFGDPKRGTLNQKCPGHYRVLIFFYFLRLWKIFFQYVENKKAPDKNRRTFLICGETGIRTPEGLTSLTVFKTAAFNHSAISPLQLLRTTTKSLGHWSFSHFNSSYNHTFIHSYGWATNISIV